MAGKQSLYIFCRTSTATIRRFVILWAMSWGHTFADDGWQHGLSFFGDFKYPPGFSHFDYVNPDAPKGGRLVLAYGYAFNSFTPYITKGIGAPGTLVIGQMTLYDSLMWPSGGMMSLGKVAMMPEHYWRDRDSSKTTTEPPLSSGPYQIVDFELGKYIEFKRVDDYWGRDLGIHRGRHNIDVIRYEVYRDATEQREALRKGLIDYFVEPSAAQWVTGYELDGKRAGLLVKEEQHYRHAIGVTSALAYNLTQPRFQDVRVREASCSASHMAGFSHSTLCFHVHRCLIVTLSGVPHRSWRGTRFSNMRNAAGPKAVN